jgi:hypothetical protein
MMLGGRPGMPGGMMRPGMMGPGGMMPGMQRRLSEKDTETFLKEEFPQILESYRALKDTKNPEATEQRAAIEHFAGEMQDLRATVPDEFAKQKEESALNVSSDVLVWRIHNTEKGPEKQKLVKELTGVVNQIFEVREKRRAEEAERLEQELKKIRSLLEERRKNREVIIERRVRELMGEDDALHW